MKKMTVAVLFGGVNTEHEVSIITAIQGIKALEEAGYNTIPVYISKQGVWILGDQTFSDPKTYINLDKLITKFKTCYLIPAKTPSLQIDSGLLAKKILTFDVAFPIFHGKNGEDGTIQGLLKLYNIPYAGCTHIPSSVGMDKHVSKRVASDLGIKTTKDLVIFKSDWQKDQQNIISHAFKLSPVLFVKPAKLGSSIGITKVKNKTELKRAIEVAFAYDTKVLIEESIENMKEINISILGNNPYQVSATEMPTGSDEILSFKDKYLTGSKKSKDHRQIGMASLKRQVPAPINKKLIAQIEKHSIDFFSAIEGRGMARIDYMVTNSGAIYFNEINTIPGSLAFYLWKASNLPFPQLMDTLVKLAITNHQSEQKLTTTFDSNILRHYDANSAKGGKI